MGISTLLLNTFIIIICILSYHVFWLEFKEKITCNHILISILSAIAIIFCMTFPFHLHAGFIYDLRFIPIILVFLYGNTKNIVFIGILYLSYRFYLGGNGVLPSFIIFTIISVITMFFRYLLPMYVKEKKLLLSLLLILVCTTSLSICGFVTQINTGGKVDSTLIEFLLNYIIINIFTVLLSVYLIEEMIEKYKMKEKLQRAEKFYIASELAASIAHEIHNPLTTVHGFTQLLNEKHASKLPQDQYLEIMLIEMQQIQSTINNYLSLTKPQNTLKEKIDINHILNQVKDTISPLALSYKVEIKQNITDSFYINGDPEKFRICLNNIIQNGIEAMINGGVLQINIQKIKDNIIIDIIDSGIGMSSQQIKRIALPFYSTTEKGTGLGTMIAYSIIKELNGDIEIESKLGQGTRFSISIPC
ncbi:HAMP domain-containing sensor histidine kinase [Bacillus mobilis]|uniref:HAMP domain-containing sensor histidine kinase n=1 Tax=Bacillus mobilis TaxID=2026190 RepID=UPI002E231E62|nr:HAMP domain-containing sensor histidine kinase [Bacillus mobilis]MED0930179.1 HAMP domain-containing sensor histidine kinase [Bacillus mobilis]MED0952999.1 HAMP domain-containing sensor histidine kinase [Bacillus mobilis]